MLPGPLPHAALLPAGVGPQPAHALLWGALLPAAPQTRRQVHACDTPGVRCPSQRAPSCSSLRPHTGLVAPALGALSIDPTMQTYEVPFDCRYLPYQWALLMRALASWKAWKQGWRQRTAAYWRPGAQVRAMQPPAMCLVASCLPRLDDDIIMVLPSHLIRERCARHSSNALLCRAAKITLPCRTLQVACWNSSRGITQTAVGSL